MVAVDTRVDVPYPAKSSAFVASRQQTMTFTAACMLMLVYLVPVNYVGLEVDTLYFTPVRLFLFIVFFYGVFLFSRLGRVVAHDVFFLGFVEWTIIAILRNRGIGPGLATAGSLTVEALGAYLITAGSLTSVQKIHTFIKYWFFVVLVLLPFAFFEAITHIRWLDVIMSSLTGNYDHVYRNPDVRIGLLRSSTVFRHTILHGVFCMSLLAFLWYIWRDRISRWFRVAAAAIATFCAVSSGPFVGLFFQLGAIVAEAWTKGIKHRFWLISAVVGIPVTIASFISDRGLFAFVAIFTLNEHNAYHRRLIWIHGMNNVERSPWFGINPETWERPFWMKGSIDNFWLFQMMLGGVPSVIFLVLCIAFILWRCFRVPTELLTPELDRLRRAWAFSMIAMMLVGSTVHLYENLRPHFMVVVGLGAAILRLIDLHSSSASAGTAPEQSAGTPHEMRRSRAILG